jgi:predicted N-acetyltransferase YhbS
MTIDLATASDVPAVHALVESAYRGEAARQGWTHEADLVAGQRTDLATLAAIVADPAQRLLVHREADGRITGSVVVARAGDNVAYLGMLSVAPDRQAGGLGRALIVAAEAQARAAFGAASMEMTVIASRRELVAYYQRRGYVLTGERRPFPYHDPSVGQPLRDDLEFVVLVKSLV